MDNKGENNHLQLADKPLTTTNHSTFSTPCLHNRNIPMSQTNQPNVVTPPESSTTQVTTLLSETPEKFVPSNGPTDCLDLSANMEIDKDGNDSKEGRGTTKEDSGRKKKHRKLL